MNLTRKRIVLLKGVTADEATSQPIRLNGYTRVTCYLIGSGTITSGTVTYEEATDDPDTEQIYGGNWSVIGTTVSASDVSGGAQKATHFAVGEYDNVRARVSDAIGGGGSVSVVLVAS